MPYYTYHLIIDSVKYIVQRKRIFLWKIAFNQGSYLINMLFSPHQGNSLPKFNVYTYKANFGMDAVF